MIKVLVQNTFTACTMRERKKDYLSVVSQKLSFFIEKPQEIVANSWLKQKNIESQKYLVDFCKAKVFKFYINPLVCTMFLHYLDIPLYTDTF